MEYKDRIALMAAILLAARIQRGMAPDVNTIREAVKQAKQISEAVGD